MHRRQLIDLLRHYIPADSHETAHFDSMQNFLNAYPDCFERPLQVGHFTGSAWIVNKERTEILLTLHRKLGIWIQPGGHADGMPDLFQVAKSEAQEETGLTSIFPVHHQIFDIDIHSVPAYGPVSRHLHYDVRFLFEADESEPLSITAESIDLAWIPLQEIAKLNPEQGIKRMILKTKNLRPS